MNHFIRKCMFSTLMSLGVVNVSHAAAGFTLTAPVVNTDPSIFYFTLLSTASGILSVTVGDGGSQYSPDSLALYSDASASLVTAPAAILGGAGSTITFKNLTAGLYYLDFSSSHVAGTYTISGSSKLTSAVLTPGSVSSPVPEPQAAALALAGLGLAGFMLRRRVGT